MVSSPSERQVEDKGIAADSDTPGALAKNGEKGAARKGGHAVPIADEGHLTDALRSVYQRTVEEDIPTEMLDLLSKLG